MKKIAHLGCLLAVALILQYAPSVSAAGEGAIVITLPADLDAAQRDGLIEALGKLEQPIVIDPAVAAPAEEAVVSDLALAMGRFDDAMLAAGQVPLLVGDWWLRLTGTGGWASWLAVLAGALAVVAGLGFEYVVDRLCARWRSACLGARTPRFAKKLGLAFGWFGLEILGLVVFGAGALLTGWLILPGTEIAQLSLAVVVLAVIRVRLLLAFGHLIFAPRAPNLRMIDMPDADAKVVWRWMMVMALVAAVAFGIRDVLAGVGATLEETAFLGVVAASVVLAVRVVAFYRVRSPIRGLIKRSYQGEDGSTPTLARLFARCWHLLFAGLAVLVFFGQLYTELAAGTGGLASAALGPIPVLALLPFALGAYRALIEDLIIDPAADTQNAVIGDVVKTLGQGALILIAFVALAASWGANPFAGVDAGLGSRFARAIFDAAAAILVGWAIWQGAKVLLAHYKSEDEEGKAGEVSEEGMGKPGSRIATLLPVIRSFLFVSILMISAMMALAALGVNIGPLLAGAGVLGLAIGFGAQTLVKDVITGLFFLLEDAFRKGEYIETDAGKGAVERISMRSVRLRHHRGPLYTIAFGQMGNIVNHSRDWVKIKFELRVPFDSDLELVRKVIKRVGQDNQNDPELGPMILQPVKSQGVTQVDDSGFVIGVKFMSRPGEQFLIRREAYVRIKKAFLDNGIDFASRRVTVDSDEDEGGRAAAAGIAAAG